MLAAVQLVPADSGGRAGGPGVIGTIPRVSPEHRNQCWQGLFPRLTDFLVGGQTDMLAREEVAMKYKVALYRTDEGISVSVPALPGCWSEGDTEEEALANIRDAIQEYLAALEDRLQGAEVRELEV